MTGLFRLLILTLSIAATGCVPIPYKPAASVSHAPVSAEEASVITVSSASRRGFIEPVAKSIHQMEPRIVVIDGAAYLRSLAAAQGTLTEVLSTEPTPLAAPPADYLLSIGTPVHRQLHDTGAAAPFIPFPVIWVGYEKVQSRDSVIASLIDLRAHSAEHLEVSSTYSEVIAAAVYGVATIARPQAALRDALAADVAHKLAGLQPTGPIRILVLAQEGGSTEANPQQGAASPAQVRGGDTQGGSR
jgi:hypothetical protein